MMDESPDRLPADFNLNRADEGDRVEAADGTIWVVLESKRSGERTLVREDVVEYDKFDHPALTGAAGFFTILGAFVMTIWAGYMMVPTVGVFVDAAVQLGSVVVGWAVARVLLYWTFVGSYVFRFLEWHDHNHLIEGRDLV